MLIREKSLNVVATMIDTQNQPIYTDGYFTGNQNGVIQATLNQGFSPRQAYTNANKIRAFVAQRFAKQA